MDWKEMLANNLIAGVATTIVGILLSQRFKDLNARIERLEEGTDSRFVEFNQEISNVTEKCSSLLDTMLEKFSKWEDRIKMTLAGIDSRVQKNGSSQVNLEEVEKNFKIWDESTKDDIKEMQDRMDEISRSMGGLENKFKDTASAFNLHKLNELKASFSKLKRDFGELSGVIIGKLDNNNAMIRQLYKVLVSFRKDLKAHEELVHRLQETYAEGNKIRLFEGDKKKKKV